MTEEQAQKELADIKDKLDICTTSEENKNQIKALYLKLFNVYLKKGGNWRHTDDFVKIIENL